MLLLHLVENLGSGRGRRDAVHQDIGCGQFLAQRFGKRNNPRLGCRVVRGVGIAFLASNRCNIDDPPIPVFEHVRHNRTAGQIGTDKVDLDHTPPDLGLQFPGFCISACNPGIVDEDIDFAVASDDGLGCNRDRILVGQFDMIGRNGPECRE